MYTIFATDGSWTKDCDKTVAEDIADWCDHMGVAIEMRGPFPNIPRRPLLTTAESPVNGRHVAPGGGFELTS